MRKRDVLLGLRDLMERQHGDKLVAYRLTIQPSIKGMRQGTEALPHRYLPTLDRRHVDGSERSL